MTERPLLFPLDLRAAFGPGEPAADAASRSLARVAMRFGRAFAVVSPWAPGLSCVGGEVLLDVEAAAIEGAPRISATGTGTMLLRAIQACLGEAADLVSQYERPGDVVARGRSDALDGTVATGWIGTAAASREGPLDWVAATEAQSGIASLVPADLCLRRKADRRALQPVGPLSAGAAAGPTREAAALRAVLELCERHALALWWLGGRRPRRFPPGHRVDRAGAALLDRLRSGERGRTTSLLDISGDLDVPVVAAISLDDDGRGLACGAAARLDATEAAEAAILELCQMEMSAPLAQAKQRQGGESVLNDADRRHLCRAVWAATGCALLMPDGVSDQPDADAAAQDPFAELIRRLTGGGIVVHLVDLTRAETGVAVVRAIAPELQPYGTDLVTARLASVPREAESVGVPLF